MNSKKKSGRPPKPEGTKLSRQIHFRVTEEEYAAINRNVMYSKKKLGQYVSQAIKNAVIAMDSLEDLAKSVDGLTTSELLRTIVVKSEVTRLMSEEEYETLKSMAVDLASIRKDARQIAGRGAGNRYCVIYVDKLQEATQKVQKLLTIISKKIM